MAFMLQYVAYYCFITDYAPLIIKIGNIYTLIKIDQKISFLCVLGIVKKCMFMLDACQHQYTLVTFLLRDQ